MKTRGKTKRYRINYDYICGDGIEPCWDCGKFTDNLNHRCLDCFLKRMTYSHTLKGRVSEKHDLYENNENNN